MALIPHVKIILVLIFRCMPDIQELMVVLYLPRGLLSLTVPWGRTTARTFENVG